jgi:serine/threonine-protein kinase
MAGFFPEARVAHIGRQVCRALREAHALGCIHRDLKPANIFLTEHGDEPDFVKVLDFGLVKNVLGEGKPDEQLTQTGLFMGSPKYMAPEQIRGERVDVRTDVYSLGIIMYEMLTGKVPFERQTSLNTLMAQVNDRPPRLQETNPAIEVSPEIEDLVYRCMAKDPAERIASMDEVLAVLRRIVEPGHGLSGEYRALGSMSSGPYSKVEPTPGPSRPPTSISAIAAAARTGDGPSVSVTMSDAGIRAPSVTPMSGGSVTSPSLPPPDFRRSGLRNAFLGGFGLVVVGGAVTFAVKGQEPVAKVAALPPPVSAVATPAPSEAVAAPVVSAPTPPVATTLSVHFVTEPPGASVKEGAVELCAATPCDYAFPADMTAEHKVVLSHPGFKPETRVLHGTDSRVSVTLSPQRAWTPPVRPATPKPPEGTTPQGFKDIPY